MNSTQLAHATADSVQTIGMSFYFDPETSATAKTFGLNVFEFYGLGRGGTIGDVDVAVIDRAFTFFHSRVYDFLWTGAKQKADPVQIAANYIDAAYAFADRTFGGVDPQVLDAFARAALEVASAVPSDRHLIVDGYKKFAVPTSPVHAAYLGAILMRELRGALHIEAVHEAGITPREACYIQDATIFTMHGYQDDEVPEVTDETRAKKVEAENLTEKKMAKCFDVLTDPQREALANGARLMFEALSTPVPVATASSR
jgi:hypothetical protein